MADRLRIVSDELGKVEVTRADGQAMPLLHITDVKIHLGLEEAPRAVIEVLAPRVDVSADATIKNRCPHCGNVEETGVQ